MFLYENVLVIMSLYAYAHVSTRHKLATKVNCNSKSYFEQTVVGLRLIDDFRGVCAVKGNVPVAGHVKRVDRGDIFARFVS